jgi:(1->4)-alpha-D-glucan 1-alpha-D-glucosylmutase
MAPRHHRHSSTYRLQFRPGFGFAEARALVPYLTDLGITAVYSSPQLAATPGSTHGYDICDHRRLNPDLGTASDYAAFSDALRDAHLGHIIDVVPNHMAADPSCNLWWRDVLENGPSSPYSDFFDVDWHPIKPELKGRVLLPVLGDQYGLVLERGDLQLRYAGGTLELMSGGPGGLNLPINPRQIPRVLGLPSDRVGHVLPEDDADTREYLSVMTALENLPHYTERAAGRVEERQREKDVARQRLRRLADASAVVRAHIDACLRCAKSLLKNPAEPYYHRRYAWR